MPRRDAQPRASSIGSRFRSFVRTIALVEEPADHLVIRNARSEHHKLPSHTDSSSTPTSPSSSVDFLSPAGRRHARGAPKEIPTTPTTICVGHPADNTPPPSAPPASSPTGNVCTLQLPGGDGEYVGAVANGKPHGFGKATHPHGSVYKGEWKEGVKSGLGLTIYADGAKHVGSYANNVPHGPGTMHWGDGAKENFTYVDGEPVRLGNPVEPRGIYLAGVQDDGEDVLSEVTPFHDFDDPCSRQKQLRRMETQDLDTHSNLKRSVISYRSASTRT